MDQILPNGVSCKTPQPTNVSTPNHLPNVAHLDRTKMNSNLCLYFHHALSNSEWLSHHKRRRTTFVKTIVTSTDGQHTTETLHTMPIDTDIRRKKEIMVGQTVRLAMGQAYSIPFSMVTRKGCSVVIEIWGELHAKSNAQETVLRKEAKRMLLGRTTSMKSEDMHINVRSNRPTATEIGYGKKDDAKPFRSCESCRM